MLKNHMYIRLTLIIDKRFVVPIHFAYLNWATIPMPGFPNGLIRKR